MLWRSAWVHFLRQKRLFHFASNLPDSTIVQYAASSKEIFFARPAFVLARAAFARLDRLTLWVLDFTAMTYLYFRLSQKPSMSVSGLWQNSGCLDIKLVNLDFFWLSSSSMTLFFSALTKTQNKSTLLVLKYFLWLSTLRSRWLLHPNVRVFRNFSSKANLIAIFVLPCSSNWMLFGLKRWLICPECSLSLVYATKNISQYVWSSFFPSMVISFTSSLQRAFVSKTVNNNLRQLNYWFNEKP